MNTQNEQADSRSLHTDSTGKPCAPKTANPKAHDKPILSKTPTGNTSPINPAWVEEIVSEIGISGNLGKKVALELSSRISAVVLDKFDRARLIKLTKAAIADAIE